MAAPTKPVDNGTGESSFDIAPESGSFTALEPNYYTLTLLSYKVRNREADGKYHTEAYKDVEFTWDVSVPAEVREALELGDEAISRKSWANVPKTFTDKSILVQIGIALGAFTAESAAEGVHVDLNTWLGRKCRGNIVQKTKPDGTFADKIDGYIALPRGKAGTAARPAPRPAPQPAAVEDPDADISF